MPIPLTPAIYEHAAYLIGQSPWAVSRDAELLARAHVEAHTLYGHPVIIPGIDVYNLEAEAYGCAVQVPSANNIPTISEHPYEAADEIEDLPDLDLSAGRIPMLLDAAHRLRTLKPEVPIALPIAGPFAVAMNLLGIDNLMCELLDCPEDVLAALNKIRVGQIKLCHAIHQEGFEVCVFESGAAPPLVSPALFESLIYGALDGFCAEAHQVFGKGVSLILGGDTASVIDSVAKLPVGFMICPSETDQAAWLNGMRERPDVTVRINMSASILASGNENAIRAELARIHALIALRPENTHLGTGVLPYDFQPDIYRQLRELDL